MQTANESESCVSGSERVFNSEHFDMRFDTMHLMDTELLVQWFQWLYNFVNQNA